MITCFARRLRRIRADVGAISAEYAVVIIAGVAFAGLLFKVITSPGVQQALTELVSRALKQ